VPGIYLFRGSVDARAVDEEFRSHLYAYAVACTALTLASIQ
jgi:hypothetical protein